MQQHDHNVMEACIRMRQGQFKHVDHVFGVDKLPEMAIIRKSFRVEAKLYTSHTNATHDTMLMQLAKDAVCGTVALSNDAPMMEEWSGEVRFHLLWWLQQTVTTTYWQRSLNLSDVVVKSGCPRVLQWAHKHLHVCCFSADVVESAVL